MTSPLSELRSLVFSDQYLLREMVDFLDTTSLLALSLTSKSFRLFASRSEIWDVETNQNGVCRWPWDDLGKRSLISYVNHRHLDKQVLSFVQTMSSQQLLQLLSDQSSAHAIFLLQHLSSKSKYPTIKHLEMLGLTVPSYPADTAALISKALLFLKSKILQWKWDVTLRTMSGNDLLLEGFQLIADAKSHLTSVSLDGLVDMNGIEALNGVSSGQREGMDCHRTVVQHAIGSMTAIVWRNLLQQILTITATDVTTDTAADVKTDQTELITTMLSTLSTHDKSTNVSLPSYLEYLSLQNQTMMKDICTKLSVVSAHQTIWTFKNTLEKLLSTDEISFMLRLVNCMDRSKVLSAIISVIFRPNGFNFHGDSETYYDEHNSYIDSVIIRRKGIPLTLSALTKLVAARCGLKGLHFAGMPGHVLLSQFLRDNAEPTKNGNHNDSSVETSTTNSNAVSSSSSSSSNISNSSASSSSSSSNISSTSSSSSSGTTSRTPFDDLFVDSWPLAEPPSPEVIAKGDPHKRRRFYLCDPFNNGTLSFPRLSDMSHTAPRDIKTPLLSMFQRNFCNQLMAAKMRAQQQPNVDPNESNLCIYMRFSFLMYEQMVACSIYEYERRTDQGKETATETEKGPLFDDIHFPSPSTAATTITTEPDRNDDEDETIALSNGKVQVSETIQLMLTSARSSANLGLSICVKETITTFHHVMDRWHDWRTVQPDLMHNAYREEDSFIVENREVVNRAFEECLGKAKRLERAEILW